MNLIKINEESYVCTETGSVLHSGITTPTHTRCSDCSVKIGRVYVFIYFNNSQIEYLHTEKNDNNFHGTIEKRLSEISNKLNKGSL